MQTKRISKLELKNKLFFQFPKFLMLDNNYRKLTNDSKVLYVLYYERSRLSLKNSWIDNNNYVYIKYKNEKAMEILNCGSEKLSKIKKELKKYGLIDEIRQGKNMPNIIYVLEPISSNMDIDEFNDLETCEIDGCSKIEYPDIRKSNKSNNNKSNNNYINKKDSSKKNQKKEKLFSDDSLEIKLSRYLFEKVKSNNDKAKKPNFQNWAKHVDYLIRLDNFDGDDIIKIIDFCQADNFWMSNILSTKSLRKNINRLYLQSKNKNNNTNYSNNYKPANMTNYEQREYDSDYYDNCYSNVEFIKKE